jgi:hypothetical protein
MMKRLTSMIIICFVFSIGFAQVFNSASTLRPARFSLGIAPIFYIDEGRDVGLYANAGVGITQRLDFSVKLGIHDHPTYIGGDIECVILSGLPTISLAFGMHAYNKLGIDGTFNLTIPIRQVASIYGGLDVDVEFHDDETTFPLWGFIGLEVMVRKHLGLIIEIDPAITYPAWNMFGLGLAVYF